MRFPSTWLLVGALAIALPARAATELVISAPGYTLDGQTLHGSRTLRFAAPADAVEVHSIRLQPLAHPEQTTEGVLINFHDPAFRTSYTLQFVPPIGQTYTVGDYEGVLSYEIFQERPGMSVDGFSQCRPATARYTVLEVRYDGGGHIVRFSADFALACQGAGNRVVTGSVRVAAGDDTCIVAADGVSCDDLDACTPTSTCVANRCVGASTITCPASPDVCHDPVVCAPSSGECLPPTFAPNGLPCDDRSVCTDSDICGIDGCAGSQTIFCRDDDECTADLCDPVRGCVHPPAGGHCGNPGAPSTYLFVASPSGDPIGLGRNTAIVGSETGVTVSVPSRNGVDLRYRNEANYEYWRIFLGAPTGASLGQGMYPGTHYFSNVGNPSRPVLQVSGPGSSFCEGGTGSFTVHDIDVSSVDGAFTLDTLVAELEFRCTPESPSLTAVVRYHAGDAACHGAADGTPCDDASACTTGDHCERAACVGGTPTVCAAATGCSDASLCHPITGTCLPAFVRADDTECSDPDACVPEGTCQAGVCTPERDMCDDFDVCTTDGCDGAGSCVHGPIAGSCWARRGSVTIFATALGHTCSCTTRVTVQPLALYDDGRFAFPGGPATCQGTPIVVPEESGTWTRRGRRLALSTTNLPELIELAQQCGQSIVPKLSRYHTTVQLLRGGRRLRGTHVERARSGGSTSVQVTTVTRFRGVPTTSGRAIASTTKLGRCERQLIGCLRAAVSND